jgi:hypothetical protein
VLQNCDTRKAIRTSPAIFQQCDRPGHNGNVSSHQSRAMIAVERGLGTLFDPLVAAAFLRVPNET